MCKGDLSQDELDELQSHLDEAVSEFLDKGLSEEDAWALAVHRLGSAETIKNEYYKKDDTGGHILSRVFFWVMIIFILYAMLALLWEMFTNISNIGAVRITRVSLLIILAAVSYSFLYNRKKWFHTHAVRVLFTVCSVACLTVILGFFTSYESVTCNNTNKVFANNSPSSEVYKKEVLIVFARAGTENLYYLYRSYFSKDGQDYLMVKAVGKDFCAEFPVNFTRAERWHFLRRTVPPDHYDCELQGLKFDIVYDSNGAEFIFRQLNKIAD